MLAETFAFGNTNDKVVSDTNLFTSNIVGDNLTSDNFSFSFNDNQLSQEELIALFDCTIVVDITIVLNGVITTIQGKITVEGKSCEELFKKLIKK